MVYEKNRCCFAAFGCFVLRKALLEEKRAVPCRRGTMVAVAMHFDS